MDFTPETLVLIAGGLDQGNSFDALIPSLTEVLKALIVLVKQREIG